MTDNSEFPKGLEVIYSHAKNTKQKNPPVESWNPDYCGEIDIRIDLNGKWFYMGSEIKRPALVKLFSSVLRLDSDGNFYLVTPVEKLKIKVEDAPFFIVSMEKNNVEDVTSFNFYTNTQEKIELSNKNPIEINLNEKNRPKPYITVRRNLKALISRSVYYEMIDSAQEIMIENKKCLALSSNNNYFKLYEL